MLAQGYTFLFNLDAQLLFDTVLLAVAVFFLFMLMSYLLFNPARKLLKDRQDRIESDINTAVADKESAAALKAEYEGKLKDIDKVLIIGSGPIVIGQACEFDYSGTQACKALRKLGYKIVLVNSNPATIMTDPETADVTYIEPLNVERLEQIIAKERPERSASISFEYEPLGYERP